jgi:hypothetical protein
MPKKRKTGAVRTTISIDWMDKNKLRRLARKTKRTKNGDVFESDSNIFKRLLNHYIDTHPNEYKENPTLTYPQKSQDVSQQG